MAALNLQDLKGYVQAGKREVAAGTLLLEITHNLIQRRFTEIPFDLFNTVGDVKRKVYNMTGSQPEYVRLLLNGTKELTGGTLVENNVRSGDVIHVEDSDPFSNARGGQLDDVSLVQKYEMSDEEYNKRENTYRAYKKKMLEQNPNWKPLHVAQAEQRAREAAVQREAIRRAQLGEVKEESDEEIKERCTIGSRCEVTPGGRRGVIRFVGFIPELPSYVPAPPPNEDGTEPEVPQPLWIGIELDEPLGKHDGTVKGKRYFQTRANSAVIAKPYSVKVGDYPERDPFDSDEEERGEQQTAIGSTNEENDIYEEL